MEEINERRARVTLWRPEALATRAIAEIGTAPVVIAANGKQVVPDGIVMANGDVREVAGVLRGSVRPYDVCARYAGDEFIIVLSGSVLSGGARMGSGSQLTITEDDAISQHHTVSKNHAVAKDNTLSIVG